MNTSIEFTVLAIRMRQLGDILATLGTLRAIKRAYSGARILFVVDAHYHALLAKVDYIDELLPQPPAFSGIDGARSYMQYVNHIRAQRPLVTLDFHSNTRSSILAYLCGSPVRVGFDVRLRKVLYTHVEPRGIFDGDKVLPRNSHESALALARRGGLERVAGDALATIAVADADVETARAALAAAGVTAGRDALVALNPGNPYASKEWPDDYFVETARLLKEKGREVVMMWGPGEEARVQKIAGVADVSVAPPMELHMMPALLQCVSAVVTIDSGLKHLAVAAGVPTLTLFGPTSPDEWHIGSAQDAYIYDDFECSPCRLLECPLDTPCMPEITPQRVLDALTSFDAGVAAR